MSRNKFCYLYVVQGDYGYGHGWEDVSASESRVEAQQTLREYRDNESGVAVHRVVQRRELNEPPTD